jgi:hypothetical protein
VQRKIVILFDPEEPEETPIGKQVLTIKAIEELENKRGALWKVKFGVNSQIVYAWLYLEVKDAKENWRRNLAIQFFKALRLDADSPPWETLAEGVRKEDLIGKTVDAVLGRGTFTRWDGTEKICSKILAFVAPEEKI